MKRTQLPKELINDFKSNVPINDLCRKYGLSRHVVRNQLTKIGAREKTTWGGHRKDSGRKKREGSEIRAIREKNTNMSFPKQPGKANPRFNECRKYNNDFYKGGF